jgi:hypothetical protein
MPLIVSPTWIPIGSVCHLVPQMEDDNSVNGDYVNSSGSSKIGRIHKQQHHVTFGENVDFRHTITHPQLI